jgi:hypothetical protein
MKKYGLISIYFRFARSVDIEMLLRIMEGTLIEKASFF